MIDLYFLILAINAKIANLTAELVIPTEAPTNEVKAEIEAHPLTGENVQSNLKASTPFYAFH